MLKFRSSLHTQKREQEFEMSDALELHTSIVMDHIIERLKTHLHMVESVSMLPLLACIDIGRRHLHQRIEILSIGANEVKKTVGKSLGILERYVQRNISKLFL